MKSIKAILLGILALILIGSIIYIFNPNPFPTTLQTLKDLVDDYMASDTTRFSDTTAESVQRIVRVFHENPVALEAYICELEADSIRYRKNLDKSLRECLKKNRDISPDSIAIFIRNIPNPGSAFDTTFPDYHFRYTRRIIDLLQAVSSTLRAARKAKTIIDNTKSDRP